MDFELDQCGKPLSTGLTAETALPLARQRDRCMERLNRPRAWGYVEANSRARLASDGLGKKVPEKVVLSVKTLT
jgi:hypothetical protein